MDDNQDLIENFERISLFEQLKTILLVEEFEQLDSHYGRIYRRNFYLRFFWIRVNYWLVEILKGIDEWLKLFRTWHVAVFSHKHNIGAHFRELPERLQTYV